jgi:single-stranded DNA-binding protein
MLSVLANGTLVNDPRERTAANGNKYATGLLRVACEDAEPMLVSLITFSAPSVAALLALAKGDACSIAGRASLRTWEKDGATKTGLSVVADRVLSAYAAGKARKESRTSPFSRVSCHVEAG